MRRKSVFRSLVFTLMLIVIITNIFNIPNMVQAVTDDVTVSSISVSPTGSILRGQDVEVNATVENLGTASANFFVAARWNWSANIASEQYIFLNYSGGIDDEKNLTFTWETDSASYGVRKGKYWIDVIAKYQDENIPNNNKTDGFVEVTVHDIAVIDVRATPTGVSAGDSVQVNATVKNKGDYSETFDMTAYYDGNAIGTKTDVTLAAGANTTETFTWGTSGVADGSYTIKAVADVVTGEAAMDTGDNSLTDGVVNIPAIHDVAITSVTVTPTIVQLGTSVTITVKVENQGDYDETFNVTPYYGSTQAATPKSVSLGKRASTADPYNKSTLIFTWDTTSIAFGNYTIKAVADVVSGETDTSDNTYTSVNVVTPVIYAKPAGTTGRVGQTYTLDMYVDYVPDLYSWQVRITWDTSILDFTHVYAGNFLKGNPAAVWESSPTGYEADITINSPQSAYDGDQGSYASIKYNQTGSFTMANFTVEPWGTTGETPFSEVKRVDFKMRYSATSSSQGDQYRIVYYVPPSATPQVLQGWTDVGAALDTRVWSDESEPNDGVWGGTWTDEFANTRGWGDVRKIQFAVETQKSGGDTGAVLNIYEAWLTVTYERTTKFLFSVSRTAGKCGFGESTLHEYPGLSGGGWLGTIGFKVVGIGECDLPIEHGYTYTYLIDSTLTDIPRTAVGGHHYEPDPEDINGDGIIDIFDLAVVGINYGKYVTQQKNPTTWAGAGAGAWTNPQYAASSDDYYATAATKNYAEEYGDYGFVTTGWAGVASVEVGVEFKIVAGGNDKIEVAVSTDGGSNYGAAHVVIPTASDTFVWVDVTGDFSWTPSMLTDTSFKAKINYKVVGGSGTLTIYVDWLPVKAAPEPTAMHAEADVDGDGYVGIWDLTMVALMYGQEVGP